MTPKRTREQLLNEPAYTAAEVARLLALSPSTVRAWFFGMTTSGERWFKEVLEPADPHNRLLSFLNLCEVHVLAILRRSHKVPMPLVRRGMLYLAKNRGIAHPLLSRTLLVHPQHGIFVEDGPHGLLDASRGGQYAIREVFEAALSRIDWGDRDTPVRLFPVLPEADSAEAPRTVAIDPQVGFGRPLLVDAGVPTSVIADRFLAGDTIDEMADDFEVPRQAIEDALRFEQRLAA
jgi:uncharacterized protein (DUF433 family)